MVVWSMTYIMNWLSWFFFFFFIIRSVHQALPFHARSSHPFNPPPPPHSLLSDHQSSSLASKTALDEPLSGPPSAPQPVHNRKLPSQLPHLSLSTVRFPTRSTQEPFTPQPPLIPLPTLASDPHLTLDKLQPQASLPSLTGPHRPLRGTRQNTNTSCSPPSSTRGKHTYRSESDTRRHSSSQFNLDQEPSHPPQRPAWGEVRTQRSESSSDGFPHAWRPTRRLAPSRSPSPFFGSTISDAPHGASELGQRDREDSVPTSEDWVQTPIDQLPISSFSRELQNMDLLQRSHPSSMSFETQALISKPYSTSTTFSSSSNELTPSKDHLKPHSASIVSSRHLPPLPSTRHLGSGSFPLGSGLEPFEKPMNVEPDASLTLPPLINSLAFPHPPRFGERSIPSHHSEDHRLPPPKPITRLPSWRDLLWAHLSSTERERERCEAADLSRIPSTLFLN